MSSTTKEYLHHVHVCLKDLVSPTGKLEAGSTNNWHKSITGAGEPFPIFGPQSVHAQDWDLSTEINAGKNWWLSKPTTPGDPIGLFMEEKERGEVC